MTDRSVRLALLDLLWQRGVPSTMTTPAGRLPAAVVWVDTPEHPLLEVLVRAFGGHLMLELGSHHGEESPAFWIGVGRSAVLPAGVVLRAMDQRERLVGDASAIGWGAAGPLPRAELLGDRAETAWRALDDFADFPIRGGPATPPAGSAAGRGDRLDALVAAAFPLAPHITGGLNTAMTSLLRTERFATSLSLPTRAERDAWAAAFCAPLVAAR